MRAARPLALLAALAAAALAPPARAEEDAGDRVRFDLSSPKSAYYVGERIPVRLEVGLDRGFFRSRAVPLFARPMDYPVQLLAPWLDDIERAERLANPEPAGDARMRSIAVNDAVPRVPEVEVREIGGRPFAILAIERVYRAEEPGEIVLEAPRLRFAWATEFEEDFVRGPRPLDRRESVVEGEPLTLTVLPLPEEGRPAGFSGAVGRFEITSFLEESEEEGRKLHLVIRGEGNLAEIDTPPAPEIPGFHVLGALDDRGTPKRTIVYRLERTDATATEIPGLAFSFFDPTPPGRYVTLRTEPIPALPEQVARPGPPPEDESDDLYQIFGVIVLSVLLLSIPATALWYLVVFLARRLRGTPREVDPEEARAASAAAAIREGSDDPAGAFTEYLAARLEFPRAAVIGPELEGRLRDAGVPEDLAARTARRMEQLTGARYGSGEATADPAADAAIVDALEAALRPE